MQFGILREFTLLALFAFVKFAHRPPPLPSSSPRAAIGHRPPRFQPARVGRDCGGIIRIILREKTGGDAIDCFQRPELLITRLTPRA